MSTYTNTSSTNNQSFGNYDTSKIFIGENEFLSGQTYTNGGGAPVTILAGTVVGRLTANQKLIPLLDDANDGSQYPIGIVAENYTVGAGATITNMVICTKGQVDENLIVLDGSDTLDTVIVQLGRTVRDAIGAETVGIVLVGSTELNDHDNS